MGYRETNTNKMSLKMKNLSRILELIATKCDGWPGEPHKKAQDLILSGVRSRLCHYVLITCT